MPTPPPVNRLAALAAAAAAALGPTACSAPQPDEARAQGPATTALPTGETTLTIATSENSGMTRVLAAAFHARHLGITVDVQYRPRDVHDRELPGQLASDRAPDLVLLNSLGSVAPGSVRSLDDHARLYGWDRTCPSSLLDQWRADEDGKRLGAGHLWAAPAGFSLVGVYYNKELADRLGIGAPAGRKDFDAALARAKAAGILPVQLGNQQGHASFLFQSLVDAGEGAEGSSQWVNGQAGATLRTGGAAAAVLAGWAARGYLPPQANSRDLPAAVADFADGNGLFLFDGSWDAQLIDKGLHGKVGFVPFTGEDGRTTGIGTSVAYAIPTRARNPDAAAAFLDFLNSQEAAEIEFSTGFMPVAHADQVTTDKGNVMNDIAKAWSRVNHDNGLVNFFNNSTATMNDTLTAQTQRLIRHETTPEAFLTALQTDWEQGH